MHRDSVSKSFGKVIRDERMDARMTVYSLGHTYATMAFWGGVDWRTAQRDKGHSDIRTIMGYLYPLELEAHPTDSLPY